MKKKMWLPCSAFCKAAPSGVIGSTSDSLMPVSADAAAYAFWSEPELPPTGDQYGEKCTDPALTSGEHKGATGDMGHSNRVQLRGRRRRRRRLRKRVARCS